MYYKCMKPEMKTNWELIQRNNIPWPHDVYCKPELYHKVYHQSIQHILYWLQKESGRLLAIYVVGPTGKFFPVLLVNQIL